MADSTVFDVATSRRTVHSFEDRPIPDGALDRALKAAIRAPNHKLTNPWRFTIVGPEARERITDIAVALKADKPGFNETMEQKIRRKVGNPAELVVVSQVLDADEFRRREDYAACACAIQNISLVLWEEGISSKWGSGGVTRSAATYDVLGIDPELEEIIAFVWIGYPETVPDPPRTPLEDVIRRIP